MATLTCIISRSAGGAFATCKLTVTYTVSNTDTATTVASSSLAVSSISVGGLQSGKNAARSALMTALSSLAVPLVYNGATVATRTGVEARKTYTFSGSKSVTKTHTATTKTLYLVSSSYSTSISVPAKTSYTVSYDVNSGDGSITSQTKWYGETLVLSTTAPTKSGYTFKGWATSVANASSGTVAYSSGGNYTTNAAATLYAIWELSYTKPTITQVSVERCTSNGTLDDEGKYALVEFGWSVYTSNNSQYYGGTGSPYASNAPSCTITVGSTVITPSLTTSPFSAVVGNGSYSIETDYAASIVISDSQNIKDDKTTTITSKLFAAVFPMDFNTDATAVGFFRPAPDDDIGMHVHGDIHTDNHIFAGDYTGNIKSIFDIFYPVGSYYETSDSTFNPNNVWGGTWELETQGQVHVSQGSSYPVSGALTNTSDGGSTEVPYHNHSVSSVNIASSGGHTHTITNKYTNSQLASGSNSPRFRTDGNTSTTNFSSIASNTGTHTHSVPAHNTNYAGTSGNNNMPPYINVYRWHRTV